LKSTLRQPWQDSLYRIRAIFCLRLATPSFCPSRFGVLSVMADLNTKLLGRAKPQFIQMVAESLYAHCPRDDLKPPNSIKHGPSTRLNYAIWRSIRSEGILFGLARDKSAVSASPDYAIENENRYSVLLSLDYVPSLSDFAYQVTSAGKRNRRLDFAEITKTPKTRSRGTDVLETASGGKSTHRSCAKHEEDGDNPKEQPHDGDGRKELKQSHSGYSALLTPSCLGLVEIRRFYSKPCQGSCLILTAQSGSTV
jgi:hypothetical protein